MKTPHKQATPVATPKTMGEHGSVSEMVRSLSDDRAFANELDKRIQSQTFIKTLSALRNRAGLTQEELADSLGCTQGKISKMENCQDVDLRLGDILQYLSATEYEMRVFLVPKGLPFAEQVKMHALCIKRLLHQLVHLAGSDPQLVAGVEKFLFEAVYNLGSFVVSAAEKLPRCSEENPSALQVEAMENVGDGLAMLGAQHDVQPRARVEMTA